jgi:tape measure domain-containing protein
MSFGIAAQDVQKNLQMLSDVTGGNNDRFKMLALAFSQTSAAGRLMGQDVLQMINAGFNPLQQISKTTGESLIELKKRMEDGGISAEEVRKAFEDATAQGGMFHGMTDRLAQTVSGKLNIALSDLEQKLAAAGEAMAPLLLQLLDTFTRLKPILDAVINLVDGISQGLGFAIAAVTDLINSVTTFSVDTTEMNKFLDLLEQRERERAAAAKENANQEFQQKNNAINDAKNAELRAAREAAAARMKAMEEQKKAMEQAAKDQLKEIEKQQKARLKAIEDARKAQERAAKQAQDEFQRELESARKQAIAFFEERKKQNDQRRADVARGPGTGMEVGSAESVKFAADAFNMSIAKVAVPDEPMVLQRDVARKTAELLILQRQNNVQQEQAIQLARQQLTELKENKFTRFR